MYIPDAGSWLRYDSEDDGYASIAFTPTWFGSEYIKGTTEISVSIHLPPGSSRRNPAGIKHLLDGPYNRKWV